MSVRFKITAIILPTILAYATVMYIISNTLLIKSYNTIEDTMMAGELQRVSNALQNELLQFDVKLVDWANWDDTYKFIVDKNDAYIKSNLNSASLADLNVNGMIFINTKGKTVFKKFIDVDTLRDMPSEHLQQYIDTHPNLTKITSLDLRTSGIIVLPEGPLFLVARPILTSEGKGPARGTIIFVRYINQKAIKNLSDLTHLAFQIFPFVSSNKEIAAASKSLTAKHSSLITPLSGNELAGYFLIRDINNTPVLIGRVITTRSIYAQGLSTIQNFITIAILFSIVLGVITMAALERFIIRRFSVLGRQVDVISQTNDLAIRVAESGSDEIASLGKIINQMLASLSDSQKVEKTLSEHLKTENKKIESLVEERTRELEEEQARLRSSLSTMPIGIVMTDKDNNIVLMNGLAKSMLSLQSRDFPGIINRELAAMREYTLKDIEERLKNSFDLTAALERVMGKAAPYEVKELQLDHYFYHIFIVPIITMDQGKMSVVGTVLLMENITAAKNLERSKDEFFSIASHELRTPLTAIRGNTAMIKEFYPEQLKDVSLREMIDDIHESSVRLIAIVNDFLDTSRLELGKMIFKKDTIVLEALVDGVIQEYTAAGLMKNLSLKAEKPSTPLPKVIADKDRVKQILINLIGNSIKFTELGGITITFSVEDGFVRVLVTDTGRGISDEGRKLLFKKFQQAGESLFTRDAVQGAGLGLYISRMMIESMGGEMRLESSEVDKGTTFSFTIPTV